MARVTIRPARPCQAAALTALALDARFVEPAVIATG
jgi:hypothetical protein